MNPLIKACQKSTNINFIIKSAKQIANTSPYDICDFAENADSNYSLIMRILEKGMINFQDITHIYEFMFLMVDCHNENFDLPFFEEIIRNSNNPKLMCYCIAFVPGIDIDAMLEALYETKCEKYIKKLQEDEYHFAIEDRPEYKEKLKEAHEYDYFPDCLKHFGTRDINELMSLTIASKNAYLITELADYLEYLMDYKEADDIDISPLEETLINLDEPLYHYEYAASIQRSNKKALQDRVSQSGQVKYMYYMYEYVEGTDKEALKRDIINIGNYKYTKKIGTTKKLEEK